MGAVEAAGPVASRDLPFTLMYLFDGTARRSHADGEHGHVRRMHRRTGGDSD